jgi:ribosomal protein S18 acetylase RimI-like enzyme
MYRIEQANEQLIRNKLPDLIELLRDAVHGGASIGFLPPLADDKARDYWFDVMEAVLSQRTLLLVVLMEPDLNVVGAVQLTFARKQNARHRAEVEKLMVLKDYRGRGIGKALMGTLDDVARQQEVSLLVLDTRRGDVAEQLYTNFGYTRVGVIPNFARSAAGTLEDTVFFYRLLE